jgi:TRAP-type C4-dicarboxylate transport system permease small subunit
VDKAGPVTRAFALLDRFVGAICGFALILVTAVIFLNALGRYLFSFSLLGGEEFARLLTIVICYLATASLVRRDGHVSVDMLVRLAGPGLQRLMRGAVALVGVVVMLFLAKASWELVAFSAGTGQRSTTLPVPRYFFFLPIAVGASLSVLSFGEILIRAIANTLVPLPSLEGDVATPAETALAQESEREAAELALRPRD